MDPLSVSLGQLQIFALMLARVSVLFVAAPFLGNARIPGFVKAGSALMLTLLLTLANPSGAMPKPPTHVLGVAQAVLGEFFVGLVISYTAYLIFTAVQMAGQIVDIQIGYGLVNVLDPGGNQQVSILGQFYYLVALAFFLGLNGHHHLIRAMGDSFTAIPVGSFLWFERAAEAGPLLSSFFTKLFVIAFQVAAPSVATLFLTNLSMGLLSRTMPQMNVFIVGLPLNVTVGLAVTILSLRLMGTVLVAVVDQMTNSLSNALAALAT